VTSTVRTRKTNINAHLSQETPSMLLPDAVEAFLRDLARAGRSPATIRAYRGDLGALTALHSGPVDTVTLDTVRDALDASAHLAPATRARRQAALASFFKWAVRQGITEIDPVLRLSAVHVEPPLPRGVPADQVQAILAGIPRDRLRDRVLFGLIASTGLRAGEALRIHIEDVDLTRGDERVSIIGKGLRRRTVLLDDPRLVVLIKRLVTVLGRNNGALFVAEKNGVGGSLSYTSARARWDQYTASAGVDATLHQLRHSHATALINGGVSLTTIKKRLGHRNIASTLRYAELSDETADNELRAWRRKQRR
jgi:integrase/recombinase XerD